MKNILQNFTYTATPEKFHGNSESKPTVAALQTIMSLCGVSRIFTKDDAFELLTRLALILKDEPVLDNYFTDDSLFTYKYINNLYSFTIFDLIELAGFERIDTIENYIPRDKWFEIRTTVWKNTMLSSIFTGGMVSILQPDMEHSYENGELTTSVRIKAPEHTGETLLSDEISKAEFLARTALVLIGDIPFERILKEHPVKVRELEMRNKHRFIPDFSYTELSEELQKKLWKHWWKDLEHFNDSDEQDRIAKLTRLAFYFANGFISDDNGLNTGHLWGIEVIDERVDIDIEDYPVNDDIGGYNLLQTFNDEELEELYPLLYDPEVSKLAERPWEKMMQETYGYKSL